MEWEALGTGLNNDAYDVAISGYEVFACGIFTNAGGNKNADRIAKWNGTAWEALGTGLKIL